MDVKDALLFGSISMIKWVPLCFLSQYNSMVSSYVNQSLANNASSPPPLRGAVSNISGPISTSSGHLMFGSLHGSLEASQACSPGPGPPLHASRVVDEGTLEMLTTDMSLSALYLHEMRHRRSVEDIRARAVWATRQDSTTPSTPHTPSMPEIVEKPQEEDCSEKELDTSELIDRQKPCWC